MNSYTMVFAFSEDLQSVVLLRKPDNHKNQLFRGKWTAPGGLVEDGEHSACGAARELSEEAGIEVPAEKLRLVVSFFCNCDRTEDEHEVVVYGTTVRIEELNRATGDEIEPVAVFKELPSEIVWYLEPLFSLVKGRMAQPR